MSETTVPYNTQRTRTRACKRRCPGGEPCCLDAEVPHALHCCPDAACTCHGSERYLEAKRLREVSNEGDATC